jgi:hypothetical protein
MFIGDSSHVLREKKKDPKENAEKEVSMTCYTR